MISASATGIWKNTHLRGTEGKWNLLDSENPDMHQNHWTERHVRKWWNSLIPNHSLTSWTAKFSSTEGGKLMSEKKIVQISTWTCGYPEGNVAEQGKFAWSHMAALSFYSESLDKFGTAWGRGKFGVASLLSNDSIRLVVELMCHGSSFSLRCDTARCWVWGGGGPGWQRWTVHSLLMERALCRNQTRESCFVMLWPALAKMPC